MRFTPGEIDILRQRNDADVVEGLEPADGDVIRGLEIETGGLHGDDDGVVTRTADVTPRVGAAIDAELGAAVDAVALIMG